MPLTHNLRVSIILALAAACSAQDVKPPYTAPPYTQPPYTEPKSTAPYSEPPRARPKSTKPRTEPPSAQPYMPIPHSKDPGVVCVVPDFSAYGPLVSSVTPVRNNSGPDYVVLKHAQEQLDECNSVQRQQEQWARNVLSCFDNPSAPVWYEVDWRCLIGKVTVPFPPRQASAPSRRRSTAWIPETAQVSLRIHWLLTL
jgi:hypothetical protein